MKFNKFVVIYLILVGIVFLMGSWAYQEVAVKNRPLSPDEIVDTK